MPERVGSDVNVAGLLIEVRRKRTAQFVRRDPLHGDRGGRVFFDQSLDGPDGDPLPFSGDEERVHVLGGDFALVVDVVLQRLSHRLVKIDILLFSSLPEDLDPLFVPVDVLQVDADHLADSDPGVEKEREDRDVAHLLSFGKFVLGLRQRIACLSALQYVPDLFLFQVGDRLLLDLGHVDELRHILLQMVVGDQIAVQRAQGRELSGPGRRLVGLLDDLGIVRVLAVVAHEVHEVVLDIIGREGAQRPDRDLHDGNSHRLLQVFEEHLDVPDISKNGPRRLVFRDQIFIREPADEHRHVHRDVVDLFQYSVVFFVAIAFHTETPCPDRAVPMTTLKQISPHSS